MPLTVIQAGNSLQLLDQTGGLQNLTLPPGVTLRTDVPPRWETFGNYVILVNTPSQPLTIDPAGVVRLLCPQPPRLAPILTGVADTGPTPLSGTYMAKVTFVTLDAFGNVIYETDYGPPSAAVTIGAQALKLTGIDISPDQVGGRRIYRTTTGGAVYFQWIDLDGNILTSVQDDLPDAGLSLFAAPLLGTPPRLTTIAQFRGRLFGSGDVDIDHLRYTEAGSQYAWVVDNLLTIPGVGADQYGVVALAPRRDALGVGRRNLMAQVTGTGALNTDGTIDFDVVVLSNELGIESQETTKIFRDTAYFLWKDGVYTWNSSGFQCISDGTLGNTNGPTALNTSGYGNVRAWFATDSYFNRAMFPQAFALIDVFQPKYRLFLASAGSTVIDSFVDYDINDGTWWGPHKTDLFTPASAFSRTDDSNREVGMVGGTDANTYEETQTRTDGVSTPIVFDAVGKRHDMSEPDLEKYYGELSLLGKPLSSGQLQVISRVGALDTTLTATQYANLQLARQRLGRLGRGKTAQIELVNAQVGQDVFVYGYEVDPVSLVGRR